MPKRVLIVAYYFPPTSTSGAMRPLAFSRHLDREQWEPVVLAADPGSVDPEVGCDPALASRIPSDVRVIRVGHEDPFASLASLRTTSALPGSGGSAHAPMPRRRGGRLMRLAGAAAEQVWRFPDLCAPWVEPAVRCAVESLAAAPPDVVLATAPPWTGLLVGARLAGHFDVPLVVDFRDPWTLNEAKYGTRSIAVWRARRREAKIVGQAALIVANTEASARALARRYPAAAGRVITISNGVDRRARPPGPPTGGPRELQLCHFGTIYGQRTPLHLLRALHRLTTEGALPAGRVPLVRFVGSWERTNEEAEQLALSLERSGVILREQGLAHDRCLEEMDRASVLLAIQPASPLQIPGKLYEYVAAGRPILLIGGEGATQELMEQLALGSYCPDEEVAIVRTIKCILSGHQLKPPGGEAGARFDYASLTRRLAAAMAPLCTARAAEPPAVVRAITP